MSRGVLTSKLFECRIDYLEKYFAEAKYPWELIARIGEIIETLTKNGLGGFSDIGGSVFVGEKVHIDKNATVEGPAIIGSGSVLRTGAYIRSNVIIGRDCVVGNSSELKNSILLDCVQVPHYNYVGDSILGNGAHLGAGAICSNLRTDRKDVCIRGERQYSTRMRKLGAMIGDGVEIGCGCVLAPGCVIGKESWVYPLTFVRGIVDENSIVKSTNSIVKKT